MNLPTRIRQEAAKVSGESNKHLLILASALEDSWEGKGGRGATLAQELDVIEKAARAARLHLPREES